MGPWTLKPSTKPYLRSRTSTTSFNHMCRLTLWSLRFLRLLLGWYLGAMTPYGHAEVSSDYAKTQSRSYELQCELFENKKEVRYGCADVSSLYPLTNRSKMISTAQYITQILSWIISYTFPWVSSITVVKIRWMKNGHYGQYCDII